MSDSSEMPAPCILVNPPAASLGVRNAILWGKGKQYYIPDFPGPLSIKTVVRGSAVWSTSEADRLVDEGSYLVLNSGQPYTLTIDSHETVETFCLFFRRGTAEDVYRVQASDSTPLLDDPLGEANGGSNDVGGSSGSTVTGSGAPFEFFQTLHAHDDIVSPIIWRLYGRLKDKTASGPWLEDQFLEVAAALVRVQGEASKRAAMIPAKKRSTRLELYRRLLRGKELHGLVLGRPSPPGRGFQPSLSFALPFSQAVSRSISRDAEPIPPTETPSKRDKAPRTRRAKRHERLPRGRFREHHLVQRTIPPQLRIFPTRIPLPKASARSTGLAVTSHRQHRATILWRRPVASRAHEVPKVRWYWKAHATRVPKVLEKMNLAGYRPLHALSAKSQSDRK